MAGFLYTGKEVGRAPWVSLIIKNRKHAEAAGFQFKDFYQYGDKTINYVESIIIQREASNIGTFEIVVDNNVDLNAQMGGSGNQLLFDYMMMDLVCHQDEGTFQIEYGYADINKAKQKFTGFLRDYDTVLKPGGTVQYTLKGQIFPEYTENEKTFVWHGARVSDVLNDICNTYFKKKPKTLIQPTALLPDSDADRTFTQNGTNIFTFINSVLIPRAKYEGKYAEDSMYYHVSTSDDDGNFYMEFVPENYYKASGSRRHGLVQFEINAGNYGNVLRFSPKFEGLKNASVGVEAAGVSSINNDMKGAQPDPDASDTKRPKIIPAPGGSLQTMSDMSDSIQRALASYPLRATLEIVGDPTFVPLQVIYIFVHMQGMPKHWSSGFYRIEKITDSIQNGMFTSTFDLLRIPDADREDDQAGNGLYNK